MEDIRPSGAHYAVRLSADNQSRSACIDVIKLAEMLPHGSGIDGDWYIHIRKNGDVQVTGEYHQMNESGYNGWRTFRFTFTRAVRNTYHALTGPSEGKYQVLLVKGKVYMNPVRGAGEHNDYLTECMWDLTKLTSGYVSSYVIVDSEKAAKEYK
jgi:hypothetical protein